MSKNLSRLEAAVERAKENLSRIRERVNDFTDQVKDAEADADKANAELQAKTAELEKLKKEEPDHPEIPSKEKELTRLAKVATRNSARHKRLAANKIFDRVTVAEQRVIDAQAEYNTLKTETEEAARGEGEEWERSSTKLSDRVKHCTSVKGGQQQTTLAYLLNTSLAELQLGIMTEAFTTAFNAETIQELGDFENLDGLSDGKVVRGDDFSEGNENIALAIFSGIGLKELLSTVQASQKSGLHSIEDVQKACQAEFDYLNSVNKDLATSLKRCQDALHERYFAEGHELYAEHFDHSIYDEGDKEQLINEIEESIIAQKYQLHYSDEKSYSDISKFVTSDNYPILTMMKAEGALEVLAKVLGSTDAKEQNKKIIEEYLSPIKPTQDGPPLDAHNKAIDELEKVFKDKYTKFLEELDKAKADHDDWYKTTKEGIEAVRVELAKDFVIAEGAEGHSSFPRFNDFTTQLHTNGVSWSLQHINNETGKVLEAKQFKRTHVWSAKSSHAGTHSTDVIGLKSYADWRDDALSHWPACVKILDAGKLSADESSAAVQRADAALNQFDEKDRKARLDQLKTKAFSGGIVLPNASVAKYLSQWDSIDWADIVAKIKKQVEAGKTSATFEGVIDSAAIKVLTDAGYKVQIKYDNIDHSNDFGRVETVDEIRVGGLVRKEVFDAFTFVGWAEADLTDEARDAAASGSWENGWEGKS